MSEFVLADTIALENDTIQTIRILDNPRAALPTNTRVHTRDTLRRHLYVIATETTNCQNGFIELACAGDLSINLDDHSCALRILSTAPAVARWDVGDTIVAHRVIVEGRR